MIKAGIIGGTGYAAGELIRILLNHPDAQLIAVSSTAMQGVRVDAHHVGLAGDTDLVFCDEIGMEQLAELDVLFLCLAAGSSKQWYHIHREQLPEQLKIIDLSPDFRYDPDPEGEYVYGLPEMNRRTLVHDTTRVACPGSIATAVTTALVPIARNLLLNSDLHITTIVGSTEAGSGSSETTHFSWRHGNASIYRPFTHPQVEEIRTSLQHLQSSFSSSINLIPVRGDFSRGLFMTAYMQCSVELDELVKLYQEYFHDHRFTFLSEDPIDLKQVTGTNKCLIHLDRIDNKLLVTCAIDNLLKGAAGMAVHNMNLLFGLHELAGLKLKATAY